MCSNGKTVAVLGGGIAGLTAAHELNKRGYAVTVFEASGSEAKDLGGKARSFDHTDPEHGRMYGEHGFRFFPGFYTHVIETMEDIRTAAGGRVDGELHSLTTSAFYARSVDDVADGIQPERAPTGARAQQPSRVGIYLFLAWFVAGGVFVAYGDATLSLGAIWLALPIGWFVVRTLLFTFTARGGNALFLEVPGGDDRPERGRRRQSWLIAQHRWWRYPAVLMSFAPVLFVDHPVQALPFMVVIASIAWWYPVLATVRALWSILRRIPRGVRPGILESVAASLKVTAVVAACDRRTYTQWERESWWSFISAYRYSRPFQIAFATGLTRSFVATRAERMSARTGATILAQLLYDVAPTLTDRNPADRVLSSPTHTAWIEPWVRQLCRHGVRFNEFTVGGAPETLDHVEVVSLLTKEHDDDPQRGADDLVPSIGGFEFRDPATGDLRRAPDFDHYVLAVSGTAAQRILANSEDLIAADRRVADVSPVGNILPSRPFERRIPYLDGIFDLEFGWMTGMVYHLTEPVEMAEGHHLCLESEWALTAINYAPIWTAKAGEDAAARPPVDIAPWRSIISVNVSDWFSSSPRAMPANFGDLERVRNETWRQLGEHITTLRDLPAPPFVPDIAIKVLAQQASGGVVGRHPLTNDERLLVNVAGSWHRRPTAQTAFSNLVIAGDYVRTWTDFASMESANEAAKRAVNVILARDSLGEEAWCRVAQLPVPKELDGPIGLVRKLDRVAMTLGFPHPIMLLATPIGWFAGIEHFLRYNLLKPSTSGSRPNERARRPADLRPTAAGTDRNPPPTHRDPAARGGDEL